MKNYYVRMPVGNAWIMTSTVDEKLFKKIVFECDGEWTTFKGKRAFKITTDCSYGTDWIRIYLWDGCIISEAT